MAASDKFGKDYTVAGVIEFVAEARARHVGPETVSAEDAEPDRAAPHRLQPPPGLHSHDHVRKQGMWRVNRTRIGVAVLEALVSRVLNS
jgi:hypothetical protein